LPSRPSPFWWLTAFNLLAFPVLNFIYWPQVLRSGALPPDGDSIAIPMFGSVIATLIVSPVILGLAWLCLRRYSPYARLWTWRQDRPIRSIGATILFGGASILVTAGALDSLRLPWPWYEYLWTAYFLTWLPWLLGLRAAAIDQLDYDPDYADQ
jgi:hypothetical protein